MEEFHSEEYEYEEELHDSLQDDDILAIQEEYRKKRLIESLIGPVISTVFHIGLFIVLAIMITDKFKKEAAEIEVQIQEVEEVKIEEPPPIEEPEPQEVETTDVTEPVLTTVALEVETDEAALEDVNDEEPQTEDDSNMETVSDVTLSPSAFASPSLFGGRTAAGRAGAVAAFGGSKVGQQALGKALWWLKKVQNPDGSWGQHQKEAMTGLAVLTFLAHGETTLSKDFGKTVQGGIRWLCDVVNNNKGQILGKKNDGGSTRSVYSHGLVAYALSEATAMIGASEIEEAMNLALEVIVKGQNPNGGFFYGYKNSGPTNLSNASYNYQAMKAGYAAGSNVSGLKEAIDKAVAHIQSSERRDKNSYYYRSDKSDPRGPSMRAVGVLCLQLMGAPESESALRIGDYMLQNDLKYLRWEGEKGNAPLAFPLYMWYYATQVMFQRGGESWKAWRPKFEKLLVSNQHSEGYWESPSEFEADRFKMPGIDKQVYSTAHCALMLTVYYRYLPSFKLPKSGETKKEEKQETIDDIGIDLIE